MPKKNGIVGFALLLFLDGCNSDLAKSDKTDDSKYFVAAYVWPSCHDESMVREKLWSEGIGEWEIIKKGKPRFKGHDQPRVPLWGYRMDNDPRAWEQKIEAATAHGVNTFIFDWYWYAEKPFLEETINKGFLGAANNDKMNFYIMWANHDVPGNMWNHYRYKNDSVIWQGNVDWKNFKIIVDRIINQYFKQPNYFKINNKPIFSIYSVASLVDNFGGIKEAKKALDYFRDEVEKSGFPGLHIQAVGRGGEGHSPFLIKDGEDKTAVNKIVSILGINSITMYNWDVPGKYEDYLQYGEGAMQLTDKWDSILVIPFIPCISVGWDNTPRYPDLGMESVIHLNNSPESFASYFQKIKNYVRSHPEQPPLIVINAWNEWAEGSYLEPDMRWGYGYLEAVKKIMNGQYDQY
jgi:hypothetical protein